MPRREVKPRSRSKRLFNAPQLLFEIGQDACYLPPPLRERVGEGGWRRTQSLLPTPLPTYQRSVDLPRKGGGENAGMGGEKIVGGKGDEDQAFGMGRNVIE